MKASSPPLPRGAIWPFSARRRAVLRISFCSASTSERRTGPRDSGPRGAFRRRAGHVLEDLLAHLGGAPFEGDDQRVALHLAQEGLDAAVVEVQRFSKTNISSRIFWARSGSYSRTLSRTAVSAPSRRS